MPSTRVFFRDGHIGHALGRNGHITSGGIDVHVAGVSGAVELSPIRLNGELGRSHIEIPSTAVGDVAATLLAAFVQRATPDQIRDMMARMDAIATNGTDPLPSPAHREPAVLELTDDDFAAGPRP